MRVAFLSDIHGNLPAFEAVVAELDRRGPFDAIVGGGDYITRGADDAGVVRLLRDQRWTAYLRGNNEDNVLQARRAVSSVDDPLVDFSLNNLDSDALDFLATTDLCWQATGPSGQTLLCAHATPKDPYLHLWPETDERVINTLLRDHNAAVFIFGHIHLSHVRRVEAGLVANAGTVGGPNRDQNIQPCFLIAEDTGAGWTLRHVCAPYNRDAYFAELRKSGIPGCEALIRAHLTHSWGER